MEVAFFGGDIRNWLYAETGLGFDQRNALIVGLTMGFAVIAPIFSIAEDALFAVPRHLTNGSLALGATQWQTLMRVVLPTASPGIFSALMIGFGRAVGETMIVLMATGNTAVMEWNILKACAHCPPMWRWKWVRPRSAPRTSVCCSCRRWCCSC
jgi:phosphate transport system permease protein